MVLACSMVYAPTLRPQDKVLEAQPSQHIARSELLSDASAVAYLLLPRPCNERRKRSWYTAEAPFFRESELMITWSQSCLSRRSKSFIQGPDATTRPEQKTS